MRYGFTTGSCAAAATKAAMQMALCKKEVYGISIETPFGEIYEAQITDINMDSNTVSCGVIKDGGDDPDVTKGAHIISTVEIIRKNTGETKVSIEGGEGIGIVTKPGLDQQVGSAAINSVPRKMIKSAVEDVCNAYDIPCVVRVIISCPEGAELAKKTFNPKLGIEGGISIIGTSGIVVPMSTDAIIDTIRLELRQKRELGEKIAVIAFGNYGMDFLKDTYGYDTERIVKCSNFLGETIDAVVEYGYKGMLLCGHIGKLIKVAGGAMNTHSAVSDNRIEVLMDVAESCGANPDILEGIQRALTTTEALIPIKAAGLTDKIATEIVKRAVMHMDKRAKGCLKTECMLFENENGLLAESAGAGEWLTLSVQEAVRWTLLPLGVSD